jgi:DNA-directed RNA polymerase subunit RPC12/RpoP
MVAYHCEVCGYRPQRRDAQRIEVRASLELNPDTEWVTVDYVRCYECGHEWVE